MSSISRFQFGALIVSIFLPYCVMGQTKSAAIMISREVIVGRLEKVLQMHAASGGATPTSQAAPSVDVVAAEADKILPAEVPVIAKDGLDYYLDMPIALYYSDPEYVRLMIDERLLQIKMVSKAQLTLPPISEAALQAVQQQMQGLFTGIREAMFKDLVGERPLFTRDEIRAYLEAVEGAQEKIMLKPLSTWYTRPMKAQEFDSLLKEFRQRLDDTAHRVPKRLSEVDWKSSDKEKKNLAKARQVEILQEVVMPTLRIFQTKTTDPARVMDKKNVLPEFSEVEQKLQLFLERERARRRSQKSSGG